MTTEAATGLALVLYTLPASVSPSTVTRASGGETLKVMAMVLPLLLPESGGFLPALPSDLPSGFLTGVGSGFLTGVGSGFLTGVLACFTGSGSTGFFSIEGGGV